MKTKLASYYYYYLWRHVHNEEKRTTTINLSMNTFFLQS